MPVVDKVGAGIRVGFTVLVEGGGHHFGVVPNVEQIWLVVGVEANLAVNMMALCQCRVWEMEGDLGDGGLLDGTMVGVDEMIGTRVVLESSP